MKKHLLALITLFTFSLTNAQVVPGDWAYAVQAGGNTGDVARSIVTDAAGNSYVAGYFDASAFFTGNMNIISITGNGANDVFVAKYDAMGYAQWAVKAGGTMADQGQGIALDGLGNTYVTGGFSDTATFYGSSNIQLISNGGIDAFIAKFDPAGQVLWAKKAGGLGAENGSKIKVDYLGNTYVTGTFTNDTMVFYGPTNDSLFTNGQSDMFIAKFDINGDIVWASKAGGTGNDNGYGLEIDFNGFTYVAGAFLNKAYFYPGSGMDSLTSFGSNDIFLAKYDPNGYLVWVRQGGSSLTDQGSNVALDADGNVYFVGNLNGPCTFYSPLANIPVASNGSSDIFIASYTSAGDIRWAKNAGGSNSDFCSGVVINANNHIAITGSIGAGSAAFYGSVLVALTSAGSSDIFVAEYDTAGNALCAQSGGGIAFDRGWEVSSDGAGNSYVAGQFNGTATFQSTPSFTLTVGGTGSDAFFGKWLSSCSGTTGIAKNDVSFGMYPNPASNSVTLVSTQELAAITITDCLGRVVLQAKSNNTSEEIDISKFSSGIYFVLARGSNLKLVKE